MSKTKEYLLNIALQINNVRDSSNSPNLKKLHIENIVQDLRNVTFRLQKEFRNVSGFCDWYAEKQKQMEKDLLMTYFIDTRNMIVHETNFVFSSVKISNRKPYTIHPKKGKWTAISPKIRYKGNGEFEMVENDPNFKLITTFHFKDKPNEDVFDLIITQFDKLAKIVLECDKKFSKTE